jgi:peptidoglycan/LPS O-acetylase OafA/YrhL
MFGTFGRRLFHEPREGVPNWMGFAVGVVGLLCACTLILYGLFFYDYSRYDGPAYSLPNVLLGVFFLLLWSPELLPKRWVLVAGLLRICAVVFAIVIIPVLLLSL